MATTSLYEVYCIQEAVFRRVNSVDVPAQCPAAHGGDLSIDPAKTSIVERVKIKKNFNFVAYTPPQTKIKKTTYIDLDCKFIFDPSIMTSISEIKFISYLKKSGGTYDIRAIDLTHDNVIGEITGLNNEDLQVMSLSDLTNTPAENSIIEFNARVTDKKIEACIVGVEVHYEK